jgi:hypothetical protein
VKGYPSEYTTQTLSTKNIYICDIVHFHGRIMKYGGRSLQLHNGE